MSYKKQIEVARADKDNGFKRSHQSPIPHNLRDQFQTLDYFPISEDYVFELPMNRYDNPETIQMETSDGQIRDYMKVGYLSFTVDGNNADIHVYQDAHNLDHFFVPFRDTTSGPETYGAGRYMDLDRHGENFILDFNKAYSPFCAYNPNFSCPIAPFENHLKIAIHAGEKNFPLAEY